MIIYFIIGILVLILDIVTKHWASAGSDGNIGDTGYRRIFSFDLC